MEELILTPNFTSNFKKSFQIITTLFYFLKLKYAYTYEEWSPCQKSPKVKLKTTIFEDITLTVKVFQNQIRDRYFKNKSFIDGYALRMYFHATIQSDILYKN